MNIDAKSTTSNSEHLCDLGQIVFALWLDTGHDGGIVDEGDNLEIGQHLQLGGEISADLVPAAELLESGARLRSATGSASKRGRVRGPGLSASEGRPDTVVADDSFYLLAQAVIVSSTLSSIEALHQQRSCFNQLTTSVGQGIGIELGEESHRRSCG